MFAVCVWVSKSDTKCPEAQSDKASYGWKGALITFPHCLELQLYNTCAVRDSKALAEDCQGILGPVVESAALRCGPVQQAGARQCATSLWFRHNKALPLKTAVRPETAACSGSCRPYRQRVWPCAQRRIPVLQVPCR